MTDIKMVVEGLEEITRYDGKQMSLGDNDVFIRGMAQEAIDVLNEQKQKIEEQEKKIEDQEERIAIMTEGKLTLDDFHDFLFDNYFVLKICEENMAFLNKWILAYKEHVKAEHERKKEGEPE